MNNRPFPILSYPNGNGFHNPAAIGGTVSRFDIQMLAGQAIWTVISVFASRTGWHYSSSTYFTNKNLVAWMCFIITFMIWFLSIFPIHGRYLPKSKITYLLGGLLDIQQTSRLCRNLRCSISVVHNAFSFFMSPVIQPFCRINTCFRNAGQSPLYMCWLPQILLQQIPLYNIWNFISILILSIVQVVWENFPVEKLCKFTSFSFACRTGQNLLWWW